MAEEQAEHGTWRHHWVPLQAESVWDRPYYYSPYFACFKIRDRADPLPVRGGWLCEEMGLGKTVEILALINGTASLPPPPVVTELGETPLVEGPTLVVCPNSLIGQWEIELIKRSSRTLKVYRFHATRFEDPAQLRKFDVVLTTYGTMAAEATRNTKEYSAHLASNRLREAEAKVRWQMDQMDGERLDKEEYGCW